MAARKLRVMPNPYAFVDDEGRLAGVFPESPEVAGGARKWVGASLCPDGTKVLSRVDAASGSPHVQVNAWKFDMGPHERPADKHYIDGVRTGCLIAADAASAKLCGVKQPMDAEDALAREKERAVAKFMAMYGELPAFACEESK